MASVSIAMATLNGGRYLDDQLLSLATQSLKPAELVVCDDGSSDSTLSVLKDFQRAAPFPVKIFRNSERLGYRENFLRAASLCKGDLISFCDQDDVWAANKLERVVKAFNNPKVLLAFHNATVVDQRRAPLAQTFARSTAHIHPSLELSPWAIVPGFSQVFRRSLLKYSKLHRHSTDVYSAAHRMPHDQWFVFLASVFGSVCYVPDRLTQYRQHRRNCSGWLPTQPIAYALHGLTHASYYAGCAYAATSSILTVLEQIRENDGNTNQIERAIEHYRIIKKHVELRLQFYTSTSLIHRIRSVTSLIRDRAYTRTPSSFGIDNLLLDLCFGVPLGLANRAARKINLLSASIDEEAIESGKKSRHYADQKNAA